MVLQDHMAAKYTWCVNKAFHRLSMDLHDLRQSEQCCSGSKGAYNLCAMIVADPNCCLLLPGAAEIGLVRRPLQRLTCPSRLSLRDGWLGNDLCL